MTQATENLNHLFSVEGKVAIVTGGSRGIGAMITRGLVERGAKVYITSRKADECEKAAKEFQQYGDCIALPHNLSTLEGIDHFVKDFGEKEQALDILVNNAGATWGAPLEDYPESGWDKVVDLNLKSPFFLIQKLLENSAAYGARVVLSSGCVDGALPFKADM